MRPREAAPPVPGPAGDRGGAPEAAGLRALIWDVDGTLVESEELHREAFNAAFAAAGLAWRWDRDLYARLLAVAGGKERILHFVRFAGLPQAGLPGLEDLARGLHARKTALYHGLLAAGRTELRPGVARLLGEAAQAGVALAIATTTSASNVRALLEAAPAAAAVAWAAVAAGDEARAKKPAPDVYELVLARLGLAPGRCLAIEDSANGVRAARAAGIPVLAAASAYTGDDDFTGALAVLDCLGEPDLPCRALRGPAPERGFVDLAQLGAWRARAAGEPSAP